MSASKARVVLNLVRGRDVVNADQILQFTEREAARVIRKVLASAVANAVNNDGLEAETLYIKACFADEGPTLKRFKPRAKGRASRINKRTCHITIILAVLEPDQLRIVQARRDRAVNGRRAAGGGVADRRARVQASRGKRTGATDAAETQDTGSEGVEDIESTEAPETSAIDTGVDESSNDQTSQAEEKN
jgi:large subunit ribosomal protein L22